MSDDLIFGVIVVGMMIFMLGGSILGWYRRKESREMRSVDFQVLGSEVDSAAHTNGGNLQQLLQDLNITPRKRSAIGNTLTSRYGSHNIYIFDAFISHKTGKTYEKIQLIGIAIQFNNFRFPHFALKRTMFLEYWCPLGEARLKRLNRKIKPEWLASPFDLFQPKGDPPETLLQILAGKGNSSFSTLLFKSPPLHTLLCGHQNWLVYYEPGELTATPKGYESAQQVAHLLADTFAPQEKKISEVPDEIQALTQNHGNEPLK